MLQPPPRLILASASPRRRELLGLLGLAFEVIPSRYEEPPAPDVTISLPDFVRELAFHKANEVATRPSLADCFVVGADTLVTLALDGHGVPLGKPADGHEAAHMLRQLSGRPHRVYTGLALLRVEAGRVTVQQSEAVATEVRFRELSDRMIADYVATGEPLDKAGAYGAQGYAAPFIEGFQGDFFNVVGLPLCTLGRMLEVAGVSWWEHRQALPPVMG